MEKLGLVSSGDNTYALFEFSKEIKGYKESYFREVTDDLLDYYKVLLYLMCKYGYEYEYEDIYIEFPMSEALVEDFCEKDISKMCSEIDPGKINEPVRGMLRRKVLRCSSRKVRIWLYHLLES